MFRKLIMIAVLLLGNATLLQSASAQSRYVVKNPKVKPQESLIEREFHFGSDSYYILKADLLLTFKAAQAKVQTIQAQLSAENAALEAPIELVQSESSEPTTTAKAWHANKLNYGALPKRYAGQGVVVAVLDGGVDYTHPALKNRMWVNKNEIPNNGVDDDNNGYVDDYNGYDFNGNTSDPRGSSPDHGTHCSGLIVAELDNSSGAQGIAPEARVMPLRVIAGYGALTDAVRAIEYAVDNGAKVLSNSWRVYKSWSAFSPTDTNLQLLKSAIQAANDKGVIFVAATGNESYDIVRLMNYDPIYPVGFTGLDLMVGVASSSEDGSMSWFSNYGMPYTHVAAPGEGIISTITGGDWESMDGTSMATPIVSGALARGLSRGMTPAEAIERLVATSTKSSSLDGKANSGGVIDVVKYLK